MTTGKSAQNFCDTTGTTDMFFLGKVYLLLKIMHRFGQRFPPLNNAYDRKLRTLAKQVAAELGMTDFLREGVYTMLGGPNFETVAELRALRMMGVDAVGKSRTCFVQRSLGISRL